MAYRLNDVDLPDSVTLEDENDPERCLKLGRRQSKDGVIVYSIKIDWRDPDKDLVDDD